MKQFILKDEITREVYVIDEDIKRENAICLVDEFNSLFLRPIANSSFDGVEESYVEIIEVPSEIHRLKLFRGLGKLGITKEMIIGGISSIPSFTDLQKIDLIVKINEATTFSRADEDLIAMAPMFGIDDLDAFFINCNNIE